LLPSGFNTQCSRHANRWSRPLPNCITVNNRMEDTEIETIKLEKQEKLLEEQRKFRNLESDRKYYA